MSVLNSAYISRIILGYHTLGIAACMVVIGIGLVQPAESPISLPVPFLVGTAFLISGAWVFLLLDGDRNAQLFSVFCTSAAITFFIFPLSPLNDYFAYLFLLALSLTLAFMTALGINYPQKLKIVRPLPGSYLAAVVPVMALAFLSLPLFIKNGLDPLTTASPAFTWLTGAVILAFLVSQAARVIFSDDPLEREQSRLILLGLFAALLPILAWFGMRQFSPDTPFSLSFLLPSSLLPPLMAYTLLRKPEIRPDQARAHNLVYLLVGIIMICGYALLVSGSALVLGSMLNQNHPLFLGLLLFIMALLFNPARVKIQALIDERYARHQVHYRQHLESFSKELTRASDLDQITILIRSYVQHGLNPQIIHIYLYNSFSGQFEARPSENGRQTSDLHFSLDSPIAQTLEKRNKACLISDPHDLPVSLHLEKTRLALLDVQVLIPLPGREGLLGWLGLGPPKSGETFTDEAINYLETLSDQAALAIERTMVVADLERRMQDMKILTRVSQGINVTLAFDDMLEMLYAQTYQAIPTLDFHITLREPNGKYLYHVFYLENDERLIQNENLPLSENDGLEDYVITNGRPLVTDDYERECRSRGLTPVSSGIFAWMGIPLMAGADIIGVISLGNRRPTFTYSAEHLDLMKAIADQASGAIVKARLLQESEQRAKQLTLLNDVARSLTSTLAVDSLLNQILDNAVDILNCEAGSLLIPDEQTGEMVFKAASGPVAEYFSGKRLPQGTGIVGKAFDTCQPVVSSDVRQSKDWYAFTDEQTGFKTKELLVVPMLFKDRAIGVIEVINRRDNLPFTPDDVELLAAFASQAAIAIENARLYTLTDQALAARVEELSVMQRIDRQLNASLDVSRAMQITLSWAMNQSGAEAGLVGMLSENGMRLMAFEGYQEELDRFQDNLLPGDLPFIQNVLENCQPWSCSFNEFNAGEPLFKNAANQYAIPIQRESDTMGILLLENVKGERLGDEKRDFLARLCDHAAIAIANAQLYTELQAANLAKSEFISFVSHELKTPMTSIRGFTDLLTKGVVGPVNENQANFLGTIRSNVDRMAALVSDLADLSRIESGRLRLEFSSLMLDEVVNEVIQSCQAQVDEKQQELILKLQPDLPPIWVDRVRLVQILTNLVSNAYKYSPSGGQITIKANASLLDKVTGAMVETGSQEQAQIIHISIQDTGYGIDSEEQKNIFQKFFRSPDQKIRDMPGTGLGLNITKNLVEMQGGKIWFESQYRQGTTFHITIPASDIETA
jgi:signal transduction histidine kinase/putative methionine-R-sulfoxide reductase with GAF domain